MVATRAGEVLKRIKEYSGIADETLSWGGVERFVSKRNPHPVL
jgi:hypothetical protein